MGKNNIELLSIAKKYLGQGGSVFRKYCGLPAGAAYCNAYVSYIFHAGDDSRLYCDGKKETYCPHSIKWCYDNLACIPIYLALPMDVIYFDWERNGVPNHIGFVRERKSCDEIYTIEGNTSGGIVANKTRTVKYVQAVFRPHFAAKFDTSKALVIDGMFGYNSIALLQVVLKKYGTYTGDVDGILGKGTVKGIQKLIKVNADGIWGSGTSRSLQKFLGVKADGLFGPDSVKNLQAWINKSAGFNGSTPTPTPDKPKSYTGVFPVISKPKRELIANKAYELAYRDSASSKARYPSGKPTEAFKKALDKVYPNRQSWGAAPKVGASCDVFVGTCVRASGVDSKYPRGLADQKPYMDKSSKFDMVSTDPAKAQTGDIITYAHATTTGGHICIKYGDKLKHAAYKEWYGRTTSPGNRFSKKVNKDFKVWRATGTYEGSLHKGDKGTEVKRLQLFLNWYGNYKLDADGIFGDKTDDAVKKFQKATGLTADGYFGPASLAKAKEIKK